MKINIFEITLCIMLIIFWVALSIDFLTPTYHPYDVNKDGIVDIVDVLKVQKYIIEEKEK